MNSTRGILLASVAGVAIIGAGAWFYLRPAPPVEQTPAPAQNNSAVQGVQDATLEGTFECLPHRDTSGPVTLECAFGLKTSEGTHYALSTGDATPMLLANIAMGQRISVHGTLVPMEAISSDHWQKTYDIKGIMSVISVRVFEDEGKG